MTRDELIALLHGARENGARDMENAIMDRMRDDMTLEEMIPSLDQWGSHGLGDAADGFCEHALRDVEDDLVRSAYHEMWMTSARYRVRSMQEELRVLLRLTNEVELEWKGYGDCPYPRIYCRSIKTIDRSCVFRSEVILCAGGSIVS